MSRRSTNWSNGQSGAVMAGFDPGAVQTALYARLAGNLTAIGGGPCEVADRPLPGPALPVVTVGEDNATDSADKTDTGWEYSVTLHQWSDYAGRAEVKHLQMQIDALVSGWVPDIPLYTVREGFRLQFANSFVDENPEIQHGVMTYRLIVDALQPVARWDFTNGDAFSDLMFGNAVAGAIARDSLVYVSSGQARSSSLGLLCEKQSRNKCANTNLKPTTTAGTTPTAGWTTWEVVGRADLPTDVRAGLESIDPQGNVTHVYHGISNGFGSGGISGSVGNTNEHTASVFQYVVSGAVGPTLQGTSHPVYGPEGWVRRELSAAPNNAAVGMSVVALVPSEVYWAGNQLEEQPARSSLIEVSGASATRLGDDVSTIWPANLSATDFTVVVEYEKFGSVIVGDVHHVLQFDAGVHGVPLLRLFMDSALNQRLNDGVSNTSTLPLALNTPVKHAYGVSGSMVFWATDGAFNLSAAVSTGTYSAVRFGVTGPGASAINLPLDGYVRQVALYDLTPTQSVVERLST